MLTMPRCIRCDDMINYRGKTVNGSYVKKYCDECRKIVSKENGAKAKEAVTEPKKTKAGYVYFRSPDGRWMPQHRYVMEQKLGRPLKKGIESVHHINGIRDDNRPENLELWVKSQPPGQRVDDMIDFCYNFLKKYKPEILK